MKIQLLYFASLREKIGRAEEILETSCKTPGELFRDLRGRYGFTLVENDVRVAINHQFEKMDYLLKAEDHVAFIPPVAGG